MQNLSSNNNVGIMKLKKKLAKLFKKNADFW